MKTLLLALVMALGASSTLAADSSASGPFKSKDLQMQIKSAMAFRGNSVIDDKMDVIVLAITSADMDQDAFAAYYDRRRVIDQRVKDNDTYVVFFEFRPDGAYRGYSYYFASGNGCGFCGGNMGITNTVKLVNGRLTGTLKGVDTDRSFDLKLDVPVTSNDHGSPLPPDGGAPGKAYLDYHDAVVKRDAKAIRPVLSEELRRVLAEAEKDRKTAAYMSFLAKGHPSKSVRITKGFSNGKQAVLLIDGESPVSKLTGEVVLLNQGGTWRVDDELTDVVMK